MKDIVACKKQCELTIIFICTLKKKTKLPSITMTLICTAKKKTKLPLS